MKLDSVIKYGLGAACTLEAASIFLLMSGRFVLFAAIYLTAVACIAGTFVAAYFCVSERRG